MSGHRMEKVNSLLREEVNNIITKEIDFEPGVFVSAIKADTSPDLAISRIWLSIIPSQKRDFAINTLKKRTPFILSLLKKRLTMKFIPDLRFYCDDSQDKADRINSLLATIEKDDRSN